MLYFLISHEKWTTLEYLIYDLSIPIRSWYVTWIAELADYAKYNYAKYNGMIWQLNGWNLVQIQPNLSIYSESNKNVPLYLLSNLAYHAYIDHYNMAFKLLTS